MAGNVSIEVQYQDWQAIEDGVWITVKGRVFSSDGLRQYAEQLRKVYVNVRIVTTRSTTETEVL